MKTTFKIYLAGVIILTATLSAVGQKKEMQLGQSEFAALQYYNAAEYFRKAISKMDDGSPEKPHATFLLAECYRMMNEPTKAEPLYRDLASETYSDTVPVVYLRYASMLRSNGQVDQAREFYRKYLQKVPGDEEALNGLLSCDWISAGDHSKAQVNIVPLEVLNSADDDFAPAFLSPDHSTIAFTSNRISDKSKGTDQWTGSTFSDILRSKFDGSNWSNPEQLEYSGMVNSEIHEGTPSLNGEYNVMYFTRCDKMADRKAFCQIWNTKKLDTRWASPRMVYSDSTTNVGQPSVSRDELSLFFSSDRQGSIGGKDIWVIRRGAKDQPFEVAENLGAVINTAGDEVFPYLHNDTTLLFSSNGRKGFGGWDIFISYFRNGKWTEPMNLQEPFNSGYDDFGMIIIRPGEEGYFTSNRPGGKGGDDLYRFTRRTLLFEAEGRAVDLLSGAPLEGVQITMIGDDGTMHETVTDKKGVFRLTKDQVLEDRTYELTGKKTNYFAGKTGIDTWPYADDHRFALEITLEPIPEKPIVLPEILYALDKWDLQPQYQDSLTQLVGILQDNGNLVIELRSHTDTRGSDEYNNVLSQKRAQSVVDFIISQGIDPRRLVAKGYGEKVPRVLEKDLVRENYRFRAGTELNDRFINGLPSEEIKEAAYQLNRRTEFSVLSKDFTP